MNESRTMHRPVLFAVVLAPFVLVVGVVFLDAVVSPLGLSETVLANLEATGVKNPVTAVLLNFRSFDTLLEIAVLLVAVLGARVAILEVDPSPRAIRAGIDDTVLRGYVRFIAPILVLVAGYILWVGAYSPGGAFQAGAVLAALGVLMRLANFQTDTWITAGAKGIAIASGLAVFVLTGAAMVLFGRAFLEFPVDWAKQLILAIELACTVSIGTMLLSLFESTHGGDDPAPRRPPQDLPR